MRTEQSERVRLAESHSICRDVYPKRAPKVPAAHKPGDKVTLHAGTVLSVRSGYARVQWPSGLTTYELLTNIGPA
jgi:aspartyl aminopeptidase